jgi:hypothetical protein
MHADRIDAGFLLGQHRRRTPVEFRARCRIDIRVDRSAQDRVRKAQRQPLREDVGPSEGCGGLTCALIREGRQGRRSP